MCNVALRHKGSNGEDYYAGTCIILSLPTHVFLGLQLVFGDPNTFFPTASKVKRI
jgi:hypothetical protein